MAPKTLEKPAEEVEKTALEHEPVAGEKRSASSGEDTGATKKVALAGKEPFTGSCHCGYIKYEVDLDPKDLSANRCNCTFCQKLSTTNFHLKDHESNFRLLSPASKDDLQDYTRNPKTGHRYFCSKCGVHVYAEGAYEYEGQTIDFFFVNLATIDQPQDGIDLSKVKLQYADGLHDNWYGGLKDKPWPCGMV